MARSALRLALALSLALAAPVAAQERTSFKVGISAQVVTMLPIWAAEEGGFFAKQRLAVEVINMEGGSRGLQVLLSGEIQAMHVGLAPVVQANREGADFRLLAASANTIPFTIFSPPEVKTAADLKGGVVGVSTFTSESDVAVSLALSRLGLTRKDVTVVQLGGTSQRLAALLSGRVKAAPLIEPAITAAREKGLNPLVDLAAAKVPWIFDAVVVTAEYRKAHPEILTRFLKAYIEGAYLALSDEARAREIVGKKFKTNDAKVITATLGDFKRIMPLDAAPSPDGARNVLDQLSTLGIAIGSRNIDDYLDPSLLTALAKEGFFAELKKRYGL